MTIQHEIFKYPVGAIFYMFKYKDYYCLTASFSNQKSIYLPIKLISVHVLK